MEDFIESPIKVVVMVKGIGGEVSAMWEGMVNWCIEDENGVVHQLKLKDTCYHEGSPYHLLSLQHMEQHEDNNHPKNANVGHNLQCFH